MALVITHAKVSTQADGTDPNRVQPSSDWNAAHVLSGVASAAQGGTGAATFTAHGVLLGAGASAFGATAVGGDGTVMIGHAGADPSFTERPFFGNSTNGYLAIERDGDGGITSATSGWTATPQARFRLSRAVADPAGAQHFLITPYQFGIAFEYPSVVEWWVEEFSVHKPSNLSQGARFWVGDESDTGGLYATASNAQGWSEIASQKFTLASHGNLFFRVVSATDSFQWNVGSAGSFAAVATLSGAGTLSLSSVTTTNPASAQGVFSGWEEIIGTNAASGQILLGNTVGVQGRLHYNAGAGVLYLDNSFAASIALRVDTSNTPLPALVLTGTLATFNGNLSVPGYYDGAEIAAPAAPAVNTGRLYFDDNGSGKTRLMVKFNTGAAQQIAIQP